METLLVSVPDLINIAVGPPELNIKLLNTILQILARQANFPATRVQFTEKSAIKISDLVTNRNVAPGLQYYSVQGSKPAEPLDLKQCKLQLMKPLDTTAAVDTLVVQSDEIGTTAINIRRKNRPDMVATSLPETVDIVEAGKTDKDYLVRMCDMLNITKRLESAELAIEKIMALLGNMNRATNTGADGGPGGVNFVGIDRFGGGNDDFRKSIRPRQSIADGMFKCNFTEAECTKIKSSIADFHLLKSLPDLFERMEELEAHFNVFKSETAVQFEEIWNKLKENDKTSDQLDLDQRKSSESVKNSNEQDESVEVSSNLLEPLTDGEGSDSCLMKTSCTDSYIIEVVTNMPLINGLVDEVCEMKKTIAKIMDSAAELTQTVSAIQEQLLDIFARLEDFDVQMHNVNDDVNMLVKERWDRSRQYDALIEQVETLKTTKANLDEMEMILGIKADKTDLWKKVPYEEFKELQKSLSMALIDALERIVETDAGWHQAVDAIHLALKDKVHIAQAAAMTADFTQRLEALKDRIRAFAMFRLSCESAASTQKYLKDVKCIACNAQTYINPEQSLPPIPRMGKFTSTGCAGGGDRTIALTAIEAFARITVPCSKAVEIAATEEVNRFCGGKHTKITALQWCSQVGNFIEQTGAVPLASNANVRYDVGCDGVYYRVDPNECACIRKEIQRNKN